LLTLIIATTQVIDSIDSFAKLLDKGDTAKKGGTVKASDLVDLKSEVELRDWCICIMWILQHCDLERDLLPLWSSLPDEALTSFLNVIRICFDTLRVESVRDDCAIVIARVLSLYTHEFNAHIRSQGKVFELLGSLLVQLLKYSRSTTAVKQVAAFTAQFVFTFKTQLFQDAVGNNLVADLSFEILNLCHNEPESTKMSALTLLYLLLRENQVAAGQFSRMKFQSTMALSKLMKQEDCVR
jgi:hypothetical protein